MKTTSDSEKPETPKAEMRGEYAFDYDQSKPNRFADQFKEETIAVILDPDVARVFKTSESVNTLLRSVISSMPDDSES